MSERPPIDLDAVRAKLAASAGPEYWRGLEELAETPEFQDLLAHEFPENAEQWGADPVSRRRFLQLMSASLALAGLAACTRQPEEKIVPYIDQPEEIVPGKPLFFATAVPWRGYAMPVVVESHMGRPTKIEGNPGHPAVPAGGTDAFTQASILNLYDPDRAQVVKHAGTIASWESFVAALAPLLDAQRASRGAGFRLLTGTVTSPTLGAQIQALLSAMPAAKWHRWDGIPGDAARAGARSAFGRDVASRYRFDRARVVLSLDSDFLCGDPGSVRYAADFASGRHARRDRADLSRLYAVEATPSLAGAAADHRLAARPAVVGGIAAAVAAAVGAGGAGAAGLPPEAAKFAAAAAKDLAAHRGASLVVAGEGQPPEVHALVHAINGALGNAGTTVEYTDPVEVDPVVQLDSLRDLVGEMNAGHVQLLVILGGNPVFTAPADLDFRKALTKVPSAVRLGFWEDETSEWCRWNVPMTHALETWTDLRAFDGTITIVQPLIAPLYQGKSEHELLSALAGDPDRTSHDIVKDSWSGRHAGADFDGFWRKSLHDGFVAETALPAIVVSASARPAAAAAAPPPSGLDVVFRPDPTIWDGEWANNGWMQELPKPLTRLTWDNAILVSPATAARLGVASEDAVSVSAEGRSVRGPVLVLPGHPDDALTLHLGYGRRRTGTVGRGAGFDAFALRGSEALWTLSGASVAKTGGTWRLASIQLHNTMDGRHLVRAATVEKFRADPEFAKRLAEDPEKSDSLYPAFPTELPGKDPAWGMAIDLNTCIGCAACVVACQAENNSPVVGKDQVLRGHEMHWLRIDRYYQGGLENPKTYFEPVACMHCEKAPCEVVCPVGATVHSPEGLNEMIYNRCVGTRYCSNNCPYKVRRFNFLQYSDAKTPSLRLQKNPDVTVRSRGVMEKCSYCVQRISSARIEAEKTNAPIRDGAIQTACQQACPAGAIVFGNVHDRESRVAAMKAEPLSYGLLTELNTRPRTTYLAKIWNPNPELGEA
ncbi:MAG TPA: TAT-variant-translocated molybdopterin oxidoreductase [Thermoanaerobaculia bacterium]|nr:TAT-variant-translocated molybdopterin oxidoreductase [Thermoanaerobaculia bacterium]